MQDQPILVIGATGKTGARIVRKLIEKGENVRAGSRHAPIPFDWDDPETWAPALSGAGAVYVSYFPDLAFPGASDKIEALTALARSAGVERLVLLSGRGEPHAQLCEGIVVRSGIDYTLVRASWFAQNFSEGYLVEPALNGEITLPAGDVREPIIDVDDIADVAVAALTEDGHKGELYEVTGPELLSFADAAAELSRHMGREVAYRPISLDDFHADMTGIAGDFVADVLTEICRITLDGRNEYVTDGVERALGRPATDFAAFCRKAAASGFWKRAA
ncbi:MAG: NAD(P)H-binding protein [Rhodospirillales bacterium]|nr:NAD(P)H-binding protein [Rhodospirillales bacterium]